MNKLIILQLLNFFLLLNHMADSLSTMDNRYSSHNETQLLGHFFTTMPGEKRIKNIINLLRVQDCSISGDIDYWKWLPNGGDQNLTEQENRITHANMLKNNRSYVNDYNNKYINFYKEDVISFLKTLKNETILNIENSFNTHIGRFILNNIKELPILLIFKCNFSYNEIKTIIEDNHQELFNILQSFTINDFINKNFNFSNNDIMRKLLDNITNDANKNINIDNVRKNSHLFFFYTPDFERLFRGGWEAEALFKDGDEKDPTKIFRELRENLMKQLLELTIDKLANSTAPFCNALAYLIQKQFEEDNTQDTINNIINLFLNCNFNNLIYNNESNIIVMAIIKNYKDEIKQQIITFKKINKLWENKRLEELLILKECVKSGKKLNHLELRKIEFDTEKQYRQNLSKDEILKRKLNEDEILQRKLNEDEILQRKLNNDALRKQKLKEALNKIITIICILSGFYLAYELIQGNNILCNNNTNTVITIIFIATTLYWLKKGIEILTEKHKNPKNKISEGS